MAEYIQRFERESEAGLESHLGVPEIVQSRDVYGRDAQRTEGWGMVLRCRNRSLRLSPTIGQRLWAGPASRE